MIKIAASVLLLLGTLFSQQLAADTYSVALIDSSLGDVLEGTGQFTQDAGVYSDFTVNWAGQVWDFTNAANAHASQDQWTSNGIAYWIGAPGNAPQTYLDIYDAPNYYPLEAVSTVNVPDEAGYITITDTTGTATPEPASIALVMLAFFFGCSATLWRSSVGSFLHQIMANR